MTKYREILRLKSLGFSERNIAQSCGVSRNTVAKVLKKAAEIKLSWPLDFDTRRKAGAACSSGASARARSSRSAPVPSRAASPAWRRRVLLPAMARSMAPTCPRRAAKPVLRAACLRWSTSISRCVRARSTRLISSACSSVRSTAAMPLI